MNQGKLVRMIAYTSEFIDDYKPLNIIENQEEALTDLLMIAESRDYIEEPVQELRKGEYQDNHYVERNGIQYVIQHDLVFDYLVLYELVEEESIWN